MTSEIVFEDSSLQETRNLSIVDEPDEAKRPRYGIHEALVYKEPEVDLHQDCDCCKKNPGHKNFIPVREFCLEHLPKQHRNQDLYDFITSVADLTVRVDVKITSPNRPMFWPNTDIPYPFYDTKDVNAGKNGCRGSGRVSLVTKYVDGFDEEGYKHLMSWNLCRCQKCQKSKSPSNIWWDIEVLTATHVVFDDIDVAHTSCKLFYDDWDSAPATIDGVSVGFQNVERDWCRFTCMTCDKELGERLYAMKKQCNGYWKKVHNKYYESNKDEHKLMFLVSHPHGCSKYISIGQWQDKIHLKDFVLNGNQFFYKTSTCPGSSGATVYCLGYTGWWLFQLVHIGSTDELNYCSPGFIL